MIHKIRISILAFVLLTSCLLLFAATPIASAHTITSTPSKHVLVPNLPPCYESSCNGRLPLSGCVNTESYQAGEYIYGPNGELGRVILYYTRYCDIWFGIVYVTPGAPKTNLSIAIFNGGGTSFGNSGYNYSIYSPMLDDSQSRTQVCVTANIESNGNFYNGLACS